MEKSPTTTVAMNVHLAEGLIEEHINSMHHAVKIFSKNGQETESIEWENFQNMNWCCEQSPVEGTIELSYGTPNNNEIKQISIPVITNFGVVCTKEMESKYKITWSFSLS